MARGDHLRVTRIGYQHHGIDLGDGEVVHYAADPGGQKASACARVSTWEEFARGGRVEIRPYAGVRNPELTVERALSRVGESDYHVVFNNCEHYARWCVTGRHHSEQVVVATSVGAVFASCWIAGSIGLSVVASAGVVVNMSGAGIMSGLAATGSLVGGGAVAGVVALGAGPGAFSAALLSRYPLRDDLQLPVVERQARYAGRLGAFAGGAAGSAGAVWAISALGYPGLSAAGISSGLAAIGGIAGGGMAAGTTLAIVAPVAGAALLAYLGYRIWLSAHTPPPASPSTAAP